MMGLYLVGSPDYGPLFGLSLRVGDGAACGGCAVLLREYCAAALGHTMPQFESREAVREVPIDEARPHGPTRLVHGFESVLTVGSKVFTGESAASKPTKRGCSPLWRGAWLHRCRSACLTLLQMVFPAPLYSCAALHLPSVLRVALVDRLRRPREAGQGARLHRAAARRAPASLHVAGHAESLSECERAVVAAVALAVCRGALPLLAPLLPSTRLDHTSRPHLPTTPLDHTS